MCVPTHWQRGCVWSWPDGPGPHLIEQVSFKICLSCREVCPQALAALAHGVLDVLRLAAQGMRIQIHTAEEVQDAISGMYAILQLHGSFVTSSCGSMGPAAIIDAAEAMMLLLQVVESCLHVAVVQCLHAHKLSSAESCTIVVRAHIL